MVVKANSWWHSDIRTSKFYDRREQKIQRGEVEKISVTSCLNYLLNDQHTTLRSTTSSDFFFRAFFFAALIRFIDVMNSIILTSTKLSMTAGTSHSFHRSILPTSKI